MAHLKSELSVLYDRKEKMWHQCNQIQWLQSGDKNTRFFHGSTTKRKRKNLIKGMRDDNEVWQANEEVFSSLLNEYYAGLFSSSNPHDFEHILDGVEEVVTEDIRRDLA